MKELERRTVPAKVELRTIDGPEGRKVKVLSGLAAVYGKRSADLGGFVEVIEPGAFDASLASGENIMARGEHDARMLLGTTDAGTLRLRSIGEGLEYEVDLPDTSAGRDMGVLVERGDVRKSSFAFLVVQDRWDGIEGGKVLLRTLQEVKLIDVAPVAQPAYPQTSVSARTLEEARAAIEARKAEQAPDLELERIGYRLTRGERIA